MGDRTCVISKGPYLRGASLADGWVNRMFFPSSQTCCPWVYGVKFEGFEYSAIRSDATFEAARTSARIFSSSSSLLVTVGRFVVPRFGNLDLGE